MLQFAEQCILLAQFLLNLSAIGAARRVGKCDQPKDWSAILVLNEIGPGVEDVGLTLVQPESADIVLVFDNCLTQNHAGVRRADAMAQALPRATLNCRR